MEEESTRYDLQEIARMAMHYNQLQETNMNAMTNTEVCTESLGHQTLVPPKQFTCWDRTHSDAQSLTSNPGKFRLQCGYKVSDLKLQGHFAA